MESQELKFILAKEIDNLSNLKDSLVDHTDGLDSLDLIEKKAVRNVLSATWFDEMNEEAVRFFRSGNIKEFELNREHVYLVLEQFI